MPKAFWGGCVNGKHTIHFLLIQTLPPVGIHKECTKTKLNTEQLKGQSSLLLLACIHDKCAHVTLMGKDTQRLKSLPVLVRTLLVQASSSQDVSCSTRMISFISALIFSKVKLRFFRASSTPWLPEVLVVAKIFIPEIFF